MSSKTQISEPLAPEQRFSSRAMYRTPSEMEKTDLDGSLMYSKSTMYNLHSSFFKALNHLVAETAAKPMSRIKGDAIHVTIMSHEVYFKSFFNKLR